MSQEYKQSMEVDSIHVLSRLFGSFDENIQVIERELGVKVIAANTRLEIQGDIDKVKIASEVIGKLIEMIHKNEPIEKSRINYAIELAREGNSEQISEIMSDVILISNKGIPIKCKTLGQKRYLEALRKSTIVFAVGPAGTGKTYLAMAMAVLALKNKEVSRLILTRPAVEAGERLGFLPGDLQSKVDPYLRPLYDALYDMMGTESFTKLQERGVIEVAPMAYMRGRSLNDSFIVLDEAQNTTQEQMKMFLTRMGQGSKMVITGDVTQIDLPSGKKSGLIDAIHILQGINDISIIQLSNRDVVRHELVQNIVKAYEKNEKRRTREVKR